MQKILVLCLISAVVIISLTLRLGNLNHDLWFDEAGQFWLAKGHDHYSLDFREKGIYDVLINNRQINFDPPLFGLTLHFWTKLNDSIIWLRLLPSIFGIIAVIYIYKTLRILKLHPMIIIMITLLASIINVFVYYSQELRAYSLGMLSSIMVFYYLLNYLNTVPSKKKLKSYNQLVYVINRPVLKLIAATIIAMYSLYSLWLFVPTICLFIFLNNLRYRKFWDFFIYFSIIFTVAVVIFFNQMSYQIGGFSLGYTDQYKISGNPSLNSILQKTVQLDLGYISYIFNLPSSVRDLAIIINASTFYSLIFFAGSFFIIIFLLKLILLAPKLLQISIFFSIILSVEIHLLSLLNKFPLGGNRWNLFTAPIFLVIVSIIFHLIIKKYGWSRIFIGCFLAGLIFLNGISVYSNPRKVGFMQDVLEITPLNDSSIYIFSYGAVAVLKYHLSHDYENYDPKLIYYIHHTSLDPNRATSDLKNFLQYYLLLKSQPVNKLTIVLAHEEISTENNVRLLVKNYAKMNNYIVKEYSSGDILFYIISI